MMHPSISEYKGHPTMATYSGTDIQTTQLIVSYIGLNMQAHATIVHDYIPTA